MGKKEEGDYYHENVVLKSECNRHEMNLILKIIKIYIKSKYLC